MKGKCKECDDEADLNADHICEHCWYAILSGVDGDEPDYDYPGEEGE